MRQGTQLSTPAAVRADGFRRAFDGICAAFGILLLLPLGVALALLILREDGRPVFFSQPRVGREGALFRIWKFRTMRAGNRGRAITAAGDVRVTRIGAWLRRFKLDELPQLFNVLTGDMSLVGPRPEVPQYVRLEIPLWQAVLQARPGITDLASLIYRDEEKLLGGQADPDDYYRRTVLPAKLRLNLAYLQSRSFRRDLRLILLTMRYSLFPGSFDRDHIEKTFLAGAGINDGEFLYSFPRALDR